MKKGIFSILSILIFIQLSIAQIGLEVNQGTNINGLDEKNGYTIIGDENASNMVIDRNEIQTKSTNLPTGTLFLNDRAGEVSMLGGSTGNLTVGGYNGANKLTVIVTGSDGIRLRGDNTGNLGIQFNNLGGIHSIYDDNADANSLKMQSADEIAFNVSGTDEAMRIQSDGDIYIGHDLNGGFQPRLSVYTEDNNYGIATHNANETGFATGIYALTNGPGTDNRTGVRGSANGTSSGNSFTGVLGFSNPSNAATSFGVFGDAFGNTTGMNRYGVYGTAQINTGESWALYGNGDIYYTGIFSAPSDARLKTNIQSIDNPVLDKIMQVQVKTYNYDIDKFPHINLAHGSQIGFIAQELQAVFPNLVVDQHHSFIVKDNPEDPQSEETLIKEDLLGVKYIEIIPILTKAIQEQQVQIEALQAEIELLKE